MKGETRTQGLNGKKNGKAGLRREHGERKATWTPTTIEAFQNAYIYERSLNGVTICWGDNATTRYFMSPSRTSGAKNGVCFVEPLSKGVP